MNEGVLQQILGKGHPIWLPDGEGLVAGKFPCVHGSAMEATVGASVGKGLGFRV